MWRKSIIAICLFISAQVSAQESWAYTSNLTEHPGAEREPVTDERSDYIRRFAGRYRKSFASFNSTKLSLMKYFEEQMIRNGLPIELKSLAYMESALEIDVTSHAGARGPWQLMPGTAMELGLSVDPTLDERIDVVRSTHAAINYLKKLYRLYGDWMLAIAAYNAGPGNVNNAILRSGGTKDIRVLELYLPKETREYVRRFEAATIAWNGTSLNTVAAFKPTVTAPVGPTVTADLMQLKEERKLHAKGLASLTINAGYRLDMIADYLSVPVKKLYALNGHFDTDMMKEGSTVLILPKDKMTDFKLNIGTILANCLQRSAEEFE